MQNTLILKEIRDSKVLKYIRKHSGLGGKQNDNV